MIENHNAGRKLIEEMWGRRQKIKREKGNVVKSFKKSKRREIKKKQMMEEI